ncbi:MAG: ABC transporter ATP-binding protein [Clostridiaceae bacterium]
MPELKLENICYRYKNGERDVLSGVSCTFTGGLLSAVIGPSGSGKTTLLSIMAGLDRPMQGKISIDGEDLAQLDLDLYRRERVSMIFQAFQLFPLLTAVENVCYPMEMNGVAKTAAKERASALLEAVGIGKRLYKRFPANLSGGEQQRVAIARALSTGAKVLLADEPTGNLDSANGGRVMEILLRLAHEEGYCVVVVTHDLAIAASADRVYRLTDGVLSVEKE